MATNIISSLGAGSGIDTIKLVEDLIAIERAPEEQRLDQKQDTLEAQLSGYGVMRNAISSLQDALTTLKDADTFNAKSAAFPATDLLTPTDIQADALAGDYQIEVLATAQAHSLSSATFASVSDPVGTGTLTFSFGTWSDPGIPDPDAYTSFAINAEKAAQVITIDATNNSLTGLRDAINDADFGVSASIISDAGGFKLMITGPSGASNELEIAVAENPLQGTNTDATGLSAFSFVAGGQQLTANQAGRDASLKVNGMAVTREQNQIDDVIEGLDFTLNKASVGEVVSFSISNDKAAGEQAIRDFVTAFNEFYQAAKALTTTSTSDDPESTDGSLSRDPSARGIANQVRSLVSQTVTGADSTFNALAFAGIKTEIDGTLSIDETQLQDALDNNYELLTQLLTPSASSSSASIQVVKFADTTKAGSFDVNITAQPSQGTYQGQAIVAALPNFDFNAGSDTFNTALDTSLFDYSFKIKVGATTSDTITLSGTYSSMAEIRDELQSLINGDSKLKAAGESVAVTYDTATDQLLFTSSAYGSSSKISFSAVGADLGNLGFSDTLGTATTGTDVAGTIDGVTAFGSGNILLPAFGSELAGLSLQIIPGATTGTVTYGRGFGAELNNLLNQFLSANGLIDSRESNINDGLDEVEEDRESLDLRMERRLALLQSQFIAMERIISSLNETSTALDGLLDTLPFTAQQN